MRNTSQLIIKDAWLKILVLLHRVTSGLSHAHRGNGGWRLGRVLGGGPDGGLGLARGLGAQG